MEHTTNIFIIGIKGAALSNLAVIMKGLGKRVSGCDTDEEFITDPILHEYRIPVVTGFDPGVLPEDTELVVYSAAHGGAGNTVALEAKRRGIALITQVEATAHLMERYGTRIAVSGCHGKTTTSSLMASALTKLGAEPGYLIGVPYFNNLPGGGIGKGAGYFVVEADEYGINPPDDRTPKLLFLKPTHTICTNIDFDHPDVYASLEETKQTFLKFFKTGRLYLCYDDPVLQSLMDKLPRDRYLTYGFSPGADLRAENMRTAGDRSTFDLIYQGRKLGECAVSLFGHKNILNATGVILALLDMGFPWEKIRDSVGDFSNVKRRFELVHENGGTRLYDDYGHHPAEIRATISAARDRHPDRRIVVLFQPHTFSRTLNLKKDFAAALAESDLCLLAPIFPSAREQAEQFGVTSYDIEAEAKKTGKTNVAACSSTGDLLQRFKAKVRKHDIVITMGAGNIYRLKDDIIRVISTL